jgi:hypothetical protein
MLVKDIFEVDSYASKMGSDKDVVVVSFTVESDQPADDLVTFLERGYDFVLDADKSPGELEDGKYKVFIEIERNRRIGEQIAEMLDGVGKLCDIKNFKFRYHKGFDSHEATAETLNEVVPNSKEDYEIKIQEGRMNNLNNFFNRSYLENITIDDNNIVFKRKFSEPLRMRIKAFGSKQDIYAQTQGPVMLEHKDISEVLFFTKYLGNYNITKIAKTFIFENEGFALSLERI